MYCGSLYWRDQVLKFNAAGYQTITLATKNICCLDETVYQQHQYEGRTYCIIPATASYARPQVDINGIRIEATEGAPGNGNDYEPDTCETFFYVHIYHGGHDFYMYVYITGDGNAELKYSLLDRYLADNGCDKTYITIASREDLRQPVWELYEAESRVKCFITEMLPSINSNRGKIPNNEQFIDKHPELTPELNEFDPVAPTEKELSLQLGKIAECDDYLHEDLEEAGEWEEWDTYSISDE